MSERELRGLAASGGVAVGRALVWLDPEPPAAAAKSDPLAALDVVAAELAGGAERFRVAGLEDEAEILETNKLMVEDPTLRLEVERLGAELDPADALREAMARHAEALEALADPMLAARATDVRQLGARAVRVLSGGAMPAATEASILIARDLGPADIADLRLDEGLVLGIALADGAATSHAAIMARAFGVPMAVGIGEDLFSIVGGQTLIVEGDEGMVVVDPSPKELLSAENDLRRRRRLRKQRIATRGLPAVTRDGQIVSLLCNASTEAEAIAGLEAGADGVGLLRTELAFLDASAWPTEDEHIAVLTPTLARLRGLVATVRTFDFGADKTPAFLAGITERGLALMLSHPDELAKQLRAIVRAAEGTRLRVLLPLVESADQVRAVRALITDPTVSVGAMIETPAAVERAAEIAAEADFLSIGTNDLVQYTLGLDRDRPVASATTAGEPVILRLIGQVVDAAHAARKTVEVCGEAAGETEVATLLIGLGVDELSVAPARLDELRETVRLLSFSDAGDAARRAIASSSAREALALARGLLSDELRHETGQVIGGLGRAVP
ncbi:MAG: multiphosphoryl transfer protein [Gaiellaceae bacterium]|nr:multiphosphoryl transfer protein [Gaiellaceae bacterium]